MLRYLFVFCFTLMAIAVRGQDDSVRHVPDTVKVGAYVISVHDINFHDKEYTIRFWLWFVYDNARFDFSKQLDIPNAKEIEPPEIIVDSVDGKAWAIMKMKCVMKESWDVQDFPFDRQHLRVQIENTVFDKRSLIFVPDLKGSRFDEKEAIDGWTIRDFHVESRENDYETGFGDASNPYQVFSTFNVEMNIERNAWGLFMKIFIGMYIAFLIAIVSFTPHPSELEPRFGLPVGGLFAAVGNKYIIDSVLPESSLFTLVDTLHAFTFFAIFMTLVVSAISLKCHDNNKLDLAMRVNREGSRIVVVLYVVANLVAIGLALR
ncbi:MAG TPA: hypothetical protein VIM75_24325 [Ohtaekwangia sp.]|uniref:hypothetical protein n=1 Tax=Ohtaekwangia sp. TaxID=2066019 RepID=UPI002F942638